MKDVASGLILRLDRVGLSSLVVKSARTHSLTQQNRNLCITRSLRRRELMGVEKSGADYLCPSCKCSHGSSLDERIKIVLSDFTLHRLFDPSNHSCSQYVGDLLHVDYITIPEGCLEDRVHAFRLDYELSEQLRPSDVFVVAGHNDFMKNQSRSFIMQGLKHLSELVLSNGKNKTLSILMLLPASCIPVP